MASGLRVEYPGAIFYVLRRGDCRNPIFKENEDRRSNGETLAGACTKTGWEVHAYVLMPNHFHPVVETSRREEDAVEVAVRGVVFVNGN